MGSTGYWSEKRNVCHISQSTVANETERYTGIEKLGRVRGTVAEFDKVHRQDCNVQGGKTADGTVHVGVHCCGRLTGGRDGGTGIGQ